MIEDRHMADGSVISLRIDITEMKQREESFRLLFDSNPLPMFVCDPETWAIRSANDAAVSHYGYSRAALGRMTFYDIYGAVDSRARDLLKVRDIDGMRGRSFRHVCFDGGIIEVEVHASELVFEGRVPC